MVHGDMAAMMMVLMAMAAYGDGPRRPASACIKPCCNGAYCAAPTCCVPPSTLRQAGGASSLRARPCRRPRPSPRPAPRPPLKPNRRRFAFFPATTSSSAAPFAGEGAQLDNTRPQLLRDVLLDDGRVVLHDEPDGVARGLPRHDVVDRCGGGDLVETPTDCAYVGGMG